MTREALKDALDHCRPEGYPPELLPIFAAARKQLALMAEKCGTCGGRGLLDVERDERGLQIGAQEEFCPVCDGSGKVYPQETVKLLARIIYDENMGAVQKAVAVLDALGEKE